MTEREPCGHPCDEYMETEICDCTMFGGRRDNVRPPEDPRSYQELGAAITDPGDDESGWG